MVQRQIAIEHIAPWLVSGASGLYVIARARRLSRAKPKHDPLSHFLVHQSDVILMLCGCPAVWHMVRKRARKATLRSACSTTAHTVHQLRQIFTALLIGTSLLARKVSAGKVADLSTLALRLNKIVREGIDI